MTTRNFVYINNTPEDLSMFHAEIVKSLVDDGPVD